MSDSRIRTGRCCVCSVASAREVLLAVAAAALQRASNRDGSTAVFAPLRRLPSISSAALIPAVHCLTLLTESRAQSFACFTAALVCDSSLSHSQEPPHCRSQRKSRRLTVDCCGRVKTRLHTRPSQSSQRVHFSQLSQHTPASSLPPPSDQSAVIVPLHADSVLSLSAAKCPAHLTLPYPTCQLPAC